MKRLVLLLAVLLPVSAFAADVVSKSTLRVRRSVDAAEAPWSDPDFETLPPGGADAIEAIPLRYRKAGPAPLYVQEQTAQEKAATDAQRNRAQRLAQLLDAYTRRSALNELKADLIAAGKAQAVVDACQARIDQEQATIDAAMAALP